MKFYRKIWEIDAIQVEVGNLKALEEFTGGQTGKWWKSFGNHPDAGAWYPSLNIVGKKTLNLNYNDWIIKDGKEFYSIDNNLFQIFFADEEPKIYFNSGE